MPHKIEFFEENCPNNPQSPLFFLAQIKRDLYADERLFCKNLRVLLGMASELELDTVSERKTI